LELFLFLFFIYFLSFHLVVLFGITHIVNCQDNSTRWQDKCNKQLLIYASFHRYLFCTIFILYIYLWFKSVTHFVQNIFLLRFQSKKGISIRQSNYCTYDPFRVKQNFFSLQGCRSGTSSKQK